jgi:hypothetical protein
MKWWDVNLNPHLQQLGKMEPKVIQTVVRDLVCPGSPTLPYRRRSGETKSVCHWGQRKLLLSEVEFLNEYLPSNIIALVIYAGAAPGHHIPLLSDMFPNLRFILVDPSPFEIDETDKIKIRKQFFNLDLAHKLREDWYAGSLFNRSDEPTPKTIPCDWSSVDLFFISDVRTADWTLMSAEEVDAAVIEDLAAQAWFYSRKQCPPAR